MHYLDSFQYREAYLTRTVPRLVATDALRIAVLAGLAIGLRVANAIAGYRLTEPPDA